MDSDIGGILENLWGGDAQKNKLFFCAGYWLF